MNSLPEASWETIYGKEKGRRDLILTPRQSVVDFLPVLDKAGARRILDLGCGTGSNTLFLARKGFLVVGLDVSASAIAEAQQFLAAVQIENVVLIANDMKALPFPDEDFDAVVSINVIHHAKLSEIERTVGEIRRVLRSNGVGVVTVDSDTDYKFGQGIALEEKTYELTMPHREKGIIHHFFNENEARFLFKDFEITSLRLTSQDVAGRKNSHWEVVFAKHGRTIQQTTG